MTDRQALRAESVPAVAQAGGSDGLLHGLRPVGAVEGRPSACHPARPARGLLGPGSGRAGPGRRLPPDRRGRFHRGVPRNRSPVASVLRGVRAGVAKIPGRPGVRPAVGRSERDGGGNRGTASGARSLRGRCCASEADLDLPRREEKRGRQPQWWQVTQSIGPFRSARYARYHSLVRRAGRRGHPLHRLGYRSAVPIAVGPPSTFLRWPGAVRRQRVGASARRGRTSVAKRVIDSSS